ncbi:F0F1 ATP synthase subunit gamma [Candidatus Saccharibacteria bacterium]|nr:F0F1 ATP synthase subunit gamma [Candidatus Saccharibacteria bacterium]
MRQLTDIAHQRQAAAILIELTSAFEGIASTKIAQVKDQVQRSEKFFADLWQIYNQIRIDKQFHFGRGGNIKLINKELMILITSESSFSGDIDQRLVAQALMDYKSEANDIVVIGRHGAVQLLQAGVGFARTYTLPESEQNINVEPLVNEVQKYVSTIVYYQSYMSLMNQAVKTIKLGTAVERLSAKVKPGAEIITEANYIFEPSPHAVIDHLERSMMQIALSEVILESKLAQYASRFRAMRMAHEKADDSYTDFNRLYAHAKRHIKDERLKELLNNLRGGNQL